MLATYDDLLAFLRREGVSFREVRIHQAVEIPTQAPPVEGVLAILWQAEPALVQLIHPLPMAIPQEGMYAVADALLRINHALAIPGFGLNHAEASPYFRLVLPRHADDQLPESELQRAIRCVLTTLARFWTAVSAVALEGASPERVLTAAEGAAT